MALRLLEASVRARLRSGVAITSMAQCVEELVQNCIDASATCVAVRVDVCRFKLQVRTCIWEVLYSRSVLFKGVSSFRG